MTKRRASTCTLEQTFGSADCELTGRRAAGRQAYGGMKARKMGACSKLPQTVAARNSLTSCNYVNSFETDLKSSGYGSKIEMDTKASARTS